MRVKTIWKSLMVCFVMPFSVHEQMVWANTNRMDCAMHQCDKFHPALKNPQYLIVCEYKPEGNYKGEWAYEQGPSCSKCPKGQMCFRNHSLCIQTVTSLVQ
ncbi:unnamed protein product [Taenia asiatica]|uniref:SCP domain-containing protein n=1 Tax=Taenia asiatica TaxID=60517 RepID=A0A0R3WF47_TAEAS|nr:unnamed protein product [Taenia asiatica]